MLKKYILVILYTFVHMQSVVASDKVDISGLDHAEVLSALYKAASGDTLSVERCRSIIADRRGDIDYLGIPIKIYLGAHVSNLNTRLFDRDNGEGLAEKVISEMRKK